MELSAQESTKMEATGTSRSRMFFPMVPAGFFSAVPGSLHRSFSQHLAPGASHKLLETQRFVLERDVPSTPNKQPNKLSLS